VRPAGALQDRSIRKSLSLMLKYSPLSPFETMSDPERIDVDDEEALVASKPLPHPLSYSVPASEVALALGMHWKSGFPRIQRLENRLCMKHETRDAHAHNS